jgi:trimeric autotransporter adhesin
MKNLISGIKQFLFVQLVIAGLLWTTFTQAQEKASSNHQDQMTKQVLNKKSSEPEFLKQKEKDNETKSSILEQKSPNSETQPFTKKTRSMTSILVAANLVIPTMDLSLNPVRMNETETMTATVRNVGDVNVTNREIRYYLSTDNVVNSSDRYIGNDYVTLAVGQQGIQTISFVPQNITGLAPGIWYVGIFIPDENEVWTRSGTLQINPALVGDLKVPTTELSLNPVQMNQTGTMTSTVQEVGGAAVTNREIRYYLSTDNDFSSTVDFYLGNDFVTLPANGSGTQTHTFIPQNINGLSPGTYYVMIYIVVEDEVWTRSSTIRIDPITATPNLTIASIALNHNPVLMNQTETITVTVRETGGAALTNREIEYYLSTDNVYNNNDIYLGNDLVSLPANGSGTQTHSFIPQNVSGISSGSYFVIIVIRLQEEEFVHPTKLQINPTPTPNLTIPSTTFILNPNPVPMNQTETITATVKETGGAAVTNREIRYYLSTDNVYSSGTDIYLGNDFVSLPANGSGNQTHAFIPQNVSGVSPGTYFVIIVIVV